MFTGLYINRKPIIYSRKWYTLCESATSSIIWIHFIYKFFLPTEDCYMFNTNKNGLKFGAYKFILVFKWTFSDIQKIKIYFRQCLQSKSHCDVNNLVVTFSKFLTVVSDWLRIRLVSLYCCDLQKFNIQANKIQTISTVRNEMISDLGKH